MVIPILGLILGIVLGIFLPYSIPDGYSVYAAVGILALVDSVLGGTVAVYQGRFEIKTFITGFFGNAIIAVALTFLGEQMDVPLYLAAVFAFGNRLFENFSTVRRLIAVNVENKKKMKNRNEKSN